MLLDTNIISELARKQPDAGVVAFLAAQPKLLVSVILFHELTYGVECASPEQKPRLSAFLAAMQHRFGPQAIAVDLTIAETAARLRAYERQKGRVLSSADSFMAATALNRDAALVTRNVRDFDGLGLRLINPFSA